MGNSKQPESKADPKNDDLTKSLLSEVLASTREPIGSSDVFADSFDAPPPQTCKPRASKMEYSDPGPDLSWVLPSYLIAVAGTALAAALFLLA